MTRRHALADDNHRFSIANCKGIYAPQIGDEVDVTSDTNIFKVGRLELELAIDRAHE